MHCISNDFDDIRTLKSNIPMKFISFVALALALATTSCELFKKHKSDPKPIKFITDTTSVNPPENVEVKEPVVYQASQTMRVDLIHTKLDVRFDWSKQFLLGKATITFKPHFYPTDSLILDAKGFDIFEVSVLNGSTHQKANYTYDTTQLHIKLDKIYSRFDTVRVFIGYTAKPNEVTQQGSLAISDAKGLYFINPDGADSEKPKQIWTQGETESNSCWFPTIDNPTQRMTQEIAMTVDTQYVTLSNGLLSYSTFNPDGTRTDIWKQSLPAAPYLTMMTVGKFSIIKDKWRNIDVWYYVEPEYEKYAKNIFGHTPEMIEFFSTKFGVDYPWEKFSQICVRDYVSGAMENTTAVLHGEFLQRTNREMLDQDFEDVISHELSHHWFGDLVTCESWSNIPLNESFATYNEYLWNEYKYGRDAADQGLQSDLSNFLTTAAGKPVDLIRYYYHDKEDMFDANSYQKGGRVLHMLRKYLGDEAFFEGLKLYLNTNKYSSVEIHNLRLAFEKVSGEDLNWFFNEWFLNHGHPELDMSYNYIDSTKTERVIIRQEQDLEKNPLYKIPLEVDIYTGGKAIRKKITLNKANETFDFKLASKPDLVNVDAEKQLLCTKRDHHEKAEFTYMFSHAPLYLDRFEALQQLVVSFDLDSLSSEVIVQSLNDKFWNIRQYGLMNVKKIFRWLEESGGLTSPNVLKDRIRTKLLDMAHNDPKASVRATAMRTLNSNYKEDVHLKEIFTQIANSDSSYSVMGEALGAIMSRDTVAGMELAKKFSVDAGPSLIGRIASIFSDYGSDSQNEFFLTNAKKMKGFDKYTFIQNYTRFLSRCNTETIGKGIIYFEEVAKNGSPWWVKLSAMQTCMDMETRLGGEIERAKEHLESLSKDPNNSVAVSKATQELTAVRNLRDNISEKIKQIKKDEKEKNLINIYKSGKE